MTMNSGSIQFGDFYFSVANAETFVYKGGSGFDNITGGALADTLTGNAGNDSMNGYGGNDTVNGGLGRDSIGGGTEDDTLNGDDDRDTLSGEAGNDKVNGGTGKDHLYGGTEKDTLKGNDGDDIIQGDDGQDSIDGGANNDRIDYVAATNSTGKAFDTVANFDFNGADKFHFNSGVTGYDGLDNTGALNNATFNADLESALSTLVGHHAILFKPSNGDFKDQIFLVVDVNNIVGYDANEDYVIKLTKPVSMGSADVTDFQG